MYIHKNARDTLLTHILVKGIAVPSIRIEMCACASLGVFVSSTVISLPASLGYKSNVHITGCLQNDITDKDHV